MKKKKIICVLCSLILILGLVACDNKIVKEVLLDQWVFSGTINIGILETDNLRGDSPIALLDTGVDFDNIELLNNKFINIREIINGEDDDLNGFIDDVSGWNFIHRIPMQMDNYKNSHGTSVAGIICSVVPDSKILSLKVLDDGIVFDEVAFINALNYAESLGAKVVNCSFVFDRYSDNLYQYIKKSPMVYICAAGSDSSNAIVYPSGYRLDNVISVGGLNENGEISIYSAQNDLITIYAPGEKIKVPIIGNKYIETNGTSIAVAFVSSMLNYLLANFQIEISAIKRLLVCNSTRITTISGKEISFINFKKIVENIKSQNIGGEK